MLPLLWATLSAAFQAGAAKIDVTPGVLPVIVNCGFAERTSDKITSPLYAKALVISNQKETLALATVDSCMMPRPLIDRAKALAKERTGIPVDRMLVSATHTHSAPAAMACLGSDAQPGYAEFLAEKIAEAIAQAHARRTPAQLGAAAIDVPTHTHSRRFLYRRDRPLTDPFGQKNVFANMHPGYLHPDATGPSGPVDSGLTLLSVQTTQGAPLAVLANYSMHYFGSQGLAADYAGVFSAQLQARLKAQENFVTIFTQGTSGDLHWMDYSKPKVDLTIDQYTKGLVDAAEQAIAKIKYQPTGELAMRQTEIEADWRRPTAGRLAWAKEHLPATGVKPTKQPEIYAREAMYLSEKPKAQLILQALRIGPLALTALPNEVFAITGLKLKQRSPLPLTMNIELANGAEGYIPPPEQHALGGYTTWPARTAGLVPDTEPRVVEEMLKLLEQTTGAKRRPAPDTNRKNHWTLDEFDRLPVTIEGKHALAVEGRRGRAVYLIDAQLTVPVKQPAKNHTLLYWHWTPADRQWHHRASVCKDGALTRYVNGEKQSETKPCAPLVIRIDEGKIDEITYENKALTPAQLQAAAAEPVTASTARADH